MAYYLPSSADADSDPAPSAPPPAISEATISDLKIFWGPEICRLEYLLHLMQTGRIVDEYDPVEA